MVHAEVLQSLVSIQFAFILLHYLVEFFSDPLKDIRVGHQSNQASLSVQLGRLSASNEKVKNLVNDIFYVENIRVGKHEGHDVVLVFQVTPNLA